MARGRYTVYNTESREWLEMVLKPTGDDRALVTMYTRDITRAMKFQGFKHARAMVAKLGDYGYLVVKNERGEIVG